MPLTGKQIRHLRALGHHLDPVVLLGKNGLSEAAVEQLGEAITRHELLKIKLLPECPLDRHEAGAEVAKAIGAELVQTLGKTLLFWKRNPQAARVDLPKASGKKAKKAAAPEAAARGAGEAGGGAARGGAAAGGGAVRGGAAAGGGAVRGGPGRGVDDEDDAYADFEDDDAPKVKRPHPRVIEERAPAKRAAPANRPAPARRPAPVRRGPHRGETPAVEEPYRRPAPNDKRAVPSDKRAVPSDKRAVPSDKRAASTEKRPAPNKSDLTYNRPKGVRPAEKRPFSRDRSVPEERERRPFSREGARVPSGKAPVSREGQSAPRRAPSGGGPRRGPKPPGR